MPEILEQSAQAVCGAGGVGVWRPLLCVIGSARPVAFPMHLHLRCLPQLPSVWKRVQGCRERREVKATSKSEGSYSAKVDFFLNYIKIRLAAS